MTIVKNHSLQHWGTSYPWMGGDYEICSSKIEHRIALNTVHESGHWPGRNQRGRHGSQHWACECKRMSFFLFILHLRTSCSGRVTGAYFLYFHGIQSGRRCQWLVECCRGTRGERGEVVTDLGSEVLTVKMRWGQRPCVCPVTFWKTQWAWNLLTRLNLRFSRCQRRTSETRIQ